MVRIARERITTLFALAEREARDGHVALADRYVTLARRIGTRYNVRLVPEFRDLYCRGCSSFWVEGRTVRTRLRGGRRVRTCLRCGRQRRVLVRSPVAGAGASRIDPERPALRPEGALVDALAPGEFDEEPDDASEDS
ncbi:MAG TPA: ribonuclease P [Thermoplasmata archaeon]|nr:ribonuclease P [Thermoplasmata archaeon]